MIIVTPAVGWPEPRPKLLVTGDRAVSILDNTSASALQTAGVKLATVSSATFITIRDNLTPEVFEGIDPATGRLRDDVLPSRLSVAAINDVDIRGIDGKIEEQYIPSRLSQASLNALLTALNSTAWETDPDGVPVILAGSVSSNDITLTGTLTAGNFTAATGHADIFTSVQTTNTDTESQSFTSPNQSVTPGAPAAGKLKLYSDNNNRLIWQDSAAIQRRVSNKRLVTSWPPNSECYLGDEAINTTTGEHRIWLGATKGWRLVTPYSVSTLAERDAITNKYPGYTVYCDFGKGQNQVWESDNAWHGTQTFVVPGGAITQTSGVNDGNYRRWSTTTITDPGYSYYIHGAVSMEILQLNILRRAEVWTSVSNAGADTGYANIDIWYQDPAGTTRSFRCHTSPTATTAQTGSRDVRIDWRVIGNSANAKATNNQASHSYLVVPA